ncbi:Hypothetical protein CINCED_3A024462 [Cinara cedri]|uniref:Uncharacterized protein n=1 Tax=Cinara cedri TaxID=506608 RepID=A0A5E4MHS2_9HEMI|nr:Hypothetical protein CINCED_3A024462 [Cinara cedri]
MISRATISIDIKCCTPSQNALFMRYAGVTVPFLCYRGRTLSFVGGVSWRELMRTSKKVDKLSNQIDSLSFDITPLKERVDIIESKTNSLNMNEPKLNNNELISKMMLKQSRLKNILLFNLPESTIGSSSPKLDQTTVQTYIKYLNLESEPLQLFDLVNYHPFKILPKLDYSNYVSPVKKNVFLIFASQNNLQSNPLWKYIRFSLDRTKQQQDYMSKIRQKLLNLQ